jgi:hypothetical protein
MVRRRSGGRLELLRCGVSWNKRRLARMTRVGHPVPDVAAPAAKVFRIGADPGAELGLTEIATGARPSCDTRPGLRSRPLRRRSGLASAEPYPPPRPFFSLRPSCLSPNLLHHATGQIPDRLAPPATGDHAQRGGCATRPRGPSSARGEP